MIQCYINSLDNVSAKELLVPLMCSRWILSPLFIIVSANFIHLLVLNVFLDPFAWLLYFTITSQSVLIVISFLSQINKRKVSRWYITARISKSNEVRCPFSLYLLEAYLQRDSVALESYFYIFLNKAPPQPVSQPSISMTK